MWLGLRTRGRGLAIQLLIETRTSVHFWKFYFIPDSEFAMDKEFRSKCCFLHGAGDSDNWERSFWDRKYVLWNEVLKRNVTIYFIYNFWQSWIKQLLDVKGRLWSNLKILRMVSPVLIFACLYKFLSDHFTGDHPISFVHCDVQISPKSGI